MPWKMPGGRVSPTPYAIPVEQRRNPLLADIRAEREGQQILIVEVKCFDTNSPEELYNALGQYLVYRTLMNRSNIVYPLYLAIPTAAYHGIFQEIGLAVVAENNIKLLVVDIENEVIDLWLA